MNAQIYVKSNEDFTAIVVANQSTVYFRDTLEVPELTGIQRGVSFVKHHLLADATEIFPDKLNADDVLKDAYIRYCNVNAVKGMNPNAKALKSCATLLQTHLRWNTKGLER